MAKKLTTKSLKAHIARERAIERRQNAALKAMSQWLVDNGYREAK